MEKGKEISRRQFLTVMGGLLTLALGGFIPKLFKKDPLKLATTPKNLKEADFYKKNDLAG
jgi:hypothetical protein